MIFKTISISKKSSGPPPIYRFVWHENSASVIVLSYPSASGNVTVFTREKARVFFNHLRKEGGTIGTTGVETRDSSIMSLRPGMMTAINKLRQHG